MLLLVCARAGADEPSANNAFRDPLQISASTLRGAQSVTGQTVLALAKFADNGHARLVAAGPRGLVVYSDDSGRTWRQAAVPMQSDLVSLFFVSAKAGWAVGHDGVILRSDDGGATWRKQFDGTRAHAELMPDYQKRIAAGETALKPYLDELDANTRSGPSLPFLSVYFENEQVGYATGSFGMLVKTADGGVSWHPWLDHIDNPNFLNLNDIRDIGGNVYIAGEQGTVFRLDRARQQFVAVSPDYKGSFFRIAGNEHFLLAIGLNGVAFRSGDEGKTWTRTNAGVHASLTAAAMSSDGKRVTLVSQGGQVMTSTDDGRSFQHVAVKRPMSFADVLYGDDDDLVLAGYQGIELQSARGAATAYTVQK
ncbi:YCF48-related protein [Caballeronia sp. AZ7_KS35]|uniref:WD40/YVTN/BNR-like repeat-containing protein n=1 Tax=Caballeronia sp. AZ7_KS35 TaxID=2921762 RepID=UPI00202876BE|nr:YCF48-related protein [Caballeronia sp. AZ7_KS35]